MAYLVMICHTTVAGVTSLGGTLQSQQVFVRTMKSETSCGLHIRALLPRSSILALSAR